jgi:hypothetical protein
MTQALPALEVSGFSSPKLPAFFKQLLPSACCHHLNFPSFKAPFNHFSLQLNDPSLHQDSFQSSFQSPFPLLPAIKMKKVQKFLSSPRRIT